MQEIRPAVRLAEIVSLSQSPKTVLRIVEHSDSCNYRSWRAVSIDRPSAGFPFIGGSDRISRIRFRYALANGILRRASQHAEIAREFDLLEANFVTSRPIHEDDLADLTAKRLAIESVEPAKLHLLDVLCHFELLRTMGDAAEQQ